MPTPVKMSRSLTPALPRRDEAKVGWDCPLCTQGGHWRGVSQNTLGGLADPDHRPGEAMPEAWIVNPREVAH